MSTLLEKGKVQFNEFLKGFKKKKTQLQLTLRIVMKEDCQLFSKLFISYIYQSKESVLESFRHENNSNQVMVVSSSPSPHYHS